MKTIFKKQAIKDIAALNSEPRQKISKLIFETIPEIENIADIPHCKKIAGFSNYFRIRMGSYRIGFELRSNIVVIYRILHRKDIYKLFP